MLGRRPKQLRVRHPETLAELGPDAEVIRLRFAYDLMTAR